MHHIFENKHSQSQEEHLLLKILKNHIFQIEKSTKKSSSTEAEMAREDCQIAKRIADEQGFSIAARRIPDQFDRRRSHVVFVVTVNEKPITVGDIKQRIDVLECLEIVIILELADQVDAVILLTVCRNQEGKQDRQD